MADDAGASSSSSSGVPPAPAPTAGSIIRVQEKTLDEENPEQVKEHEAPVIADIIEVPPAPAPTAGSIIRIQEQTLNEEKPELVKEHEAPMIGDTIAFSELKKVVDPETAHFMMTIDVGRFDVQALDRMVDEQRWMEIVTYLSKCVKFHASDCVLPVPAGMLPEDLIHAELLLTPHRQRVFELIACRDRADARIYFDQHLAPLRTAADDRVRLLINEVDIIIDDKLLDPPQNMAEAAKDAEIKDYMFLYFPSLRPEPVGLPRQNKPNKLWMFGEKLIISPASKPGFRCYSCHGVFRNSSVGRLREHLEGGSDRIAACVAVLPCTRQRLAAIPIRRRRGQGQGQPQAKAPAAAAVRDGATGSLNQAAGTSKSN